MLTAAAAAFPRGRAPKSIFSGDRKQKRVYLELFSAIRGRSAPKMQASALENGASGYLR